MKDRIRTYLSTYLKTYIEEDVGTGDVTTNSIVPENHTSKARIVAKEDGVIAGNIFAAGVFMELDNQFLYEEVAYDGKCVKSGDVIAIVEGKTRAILTGERVALNILQRLSGIATLTRQFVDAVEGTGAKILDTRKTSPGHRIAEKYAVKMGGGVNHRIDLSEMALIKENHIAVAGSIKEAVKRVHKNTKVPVEVEVKNMAELKQAIKENIDRILLDNWDIESTQEAVSYVNKRIPLEASGNMTLERVGNIAKTGVDFISIGALTHSFKSLDISLLHEGV
jgi:nicotinate-nucleotide pyrophosphorylase (carboxylating)